ncbi:MAG: fatty acyl-AMP ligase [Microbacteriaceae bacterium]
MTGTLIEMLRSTADRVGDEHGIRFYETREESAFLGYAELDRSSRTMAAALSQRGLVPGDVVVLALNSDLEFIRAAYGALYAGLAIAPAPVSETNAPDVMRARIAEIAAASGARLIISQEAVLDRFRPLPTAESFGSVAVTTVAELRNAGDAKAWTEPAIDEGALATLMFTSGSTGDPKGVVSTHGTLLSSMEALTPSLNGTPDSVIVGWAPFHHAMGFAVAVILPAYLAASAVLTTAVQFQRRPIFWLQLISRHRGTMSAAANFAFALCTQFATDEQISELDLSSLDVIVNGAEPVRTETMRAFLDRFSSAGIRESMMAPGFGATETMLVTMKQLGQKMVVLDFDATALESGTLKPVTKSERSVELVSCGVAGPGCIVAIADPSTGERLADGQVGEIWAAGPNIAHGYWRRPDATAEAFGAHLADDEHDYYRTGDLGALINGEMFVTGRLKDLIIVRGRNIYPQDIEAAAARFHPAVGMGTAFELTGHPADVGIILEVDGNETPLDNAELNTLALNLRSDLVHQFSLPSLAIGFLVAGELPRTALGKVRRAFTRSALENGQLRLVYADGFSPRVQDAARSVAAG